MTAPEEPPSAHPTPSAPSASSSTSTPLSSSPYPFAAAPDIIRAHQKDAYFSGVLASQLTDLHRRLLGARSSHAWAAETRTAAEGLYLGLTTLPGNRTLGEEYCDLVQVEEGAGTAQLPTAARRAAYIASSVLLPYLLARTLPPLRTRLRALLEHQLARSTTPSSRANRTRRYLLTHLGTLTSGTHARALALAAFYFTGAYYTLSKRVLGLRYVFTRRIDAKSADRAGYEVLGVLLLFQLGVQAYTHVRASLAAAAAAAEDEADEWAVGQVGSRLRSTPDTDVSLDHLHSYGDNNALLLGGGGASGAGAAVDLPAVTHTPAVRAGGARYDLVREEALAWIKGAQLRRCTLCLDPMKDPAAMQCGHVFCWSCIGDWVREKPECPLCRREAMVQHILPLRVI